NITPFPAFPHPKAMEEGDFCHSEWLLAWLQYLHNQPDVFSITQARSTHHRLWRNGRVQMNQSRNITPFPAFPHPKAMGEGDFFKQSTFPIDVVGETALYRRNEGGDGKYDLELSGFSNLPE
ncbi:MAG: hypothetical protein GYA12_05055, partial [Chloroflexi bacterium]|nr:hypothetical protein [Chloroflexota bacterium]